MDTDKNWRSYGPKHNGQTITPENWEIPENPRLYDDIFKGSQVEEITADGLTIPGGKENNVDFVRGRAGKIVNCTLLPGAGQGGIVAKGSFADLEVINSTVPNGPKFGIQLGQFDNYWFPGRAPTRRTRLQNVSTGQGTALLVELWDAETPTVEDCPDGVTFKRVPKWKWLPYFLIMWCWVRLHGAKTK